MATEQTLSAVIKRLETATLRLEEIVKAKGAVDSIPTASGTRDLSPAADGKASPTVAAFDELIAGPLQTLIDLSASIGGLVQEQAAFVKEAFLAQRALVDLATGVKKPSDVPTLQSLLGPMQKAIEAVVSIREKNRPSPLFNHLSVISEGIPALGWVVIEPAPAPYVAEYKDSAQFYSNRVMKDNSDKKDHVDFVKAFISLLTDLFGYVKKFHTTGLSWNPKGGEAKSFTPTVAPASTAGGDAKSVTTAVAPAPAAPSKPSEEPADKGGLFSVLNKEGLTSGLRKVEKSEMTHKNPELRATSVVPAAEKPAAVAAKSFGAASKAPPKKALEGNKWIIENFSNDSNIVIKDVSLRQVVYIYNCTNSTVSIRGKVNAVTLDNCRKTGLLLESIVSTVDVVNCKSSQIQITGHAPTVAIDKTDGLQLFISKEAADNGIEFMTAKSSEVNILVEGAGEDGGFAERPVPEQLKTIIGEGGKLVTTIVEHKG
ncbi:F-actin-capping protein subunit alpha [Dinochytrium kinnereticum]|nr:F-actin-capping protein subunit alpha [Dinochytrium kinnereticum]